MCKLRSVHTGQVRRSRSDTGKKMTDKNFKLEEEKKGKERITEEYFHTEMFHVKQSAVEQRFEEQLVAFGIRLSDMQKKQFLTYYKNLVLWNQVMNLTAITDMEEVYTKHFVDSLSFIKAISGQAMPEGSRLIDVGTGAGFPGLPLAIVYPGLQVTLMDSLNKRIRFLDDTVGQLGLANIITVYAVYRYRAPEVAMMVGVRIVLGSVFSGNWMALLYSACGSFLCLLGMLLLRRLIDERHLWIGSVCGALLHNTGQMAAALLVTQTPSLLLYFPFLIVSGCLAGLFTGLCAQLLLPRLKRFDRE